jgi:dienelactone hydrolase
VGCGGGRQVILQVQPNVALRDAPLAVAVSGLRPGQHVQITGQELDGAGQLWRSSLNERADQHGRIALAHTLLEGLMRPAPGSRPTTYPQVRSTINVNVLDGSKTLAKGSVVRLLRPAGVRVVQLRPVRDGIYGEYFIPVGKRFGTPVLTFGGSNGGLGTAQVASLLASHGHPALALAYFSEPGLPAQLHNIPLEYFQRALRWMQQQPQISHRRIVTLGESYGGEASLLVGSTYPKLIDGVIAYVPLDIITSAPADPAIPAWTLHGHPVTPGKPISVQKIDGPVFAVGSYGDQLWSSGSAVNDLKFELKGHHPTPMLLDFQKAGHALGAILPNIPTLTHGKSRYGVFNLGGTPTEDERAREQTWPKLLAWLNKIPLTSTPHA